MTEKLGFDQTFRQRSAVDWNKGASGPAAFTMDGIGDQLFAGSGFTGYMNGVVIAGNITDLFKNIEHFAVLSDNIAEARQFPGFHLQTEQSGNVFEGSQNTGELAVAVLHTGNGHLDSPVFAGFGSEVERILGFSGRCRVIIAKHTAFATKWTAERLVAISAQHLLSTVSGNMFGLRVEKKDAPVHVMSDDAFFEIIQDVFQVILVTH